MLKDSNIVILRVLVLSFVVLDLVWAFSRICHAYLGCNLCVFNEFTYPQNLC
jgi:hypothetical protein